MQSTYLAGILARFSKHPLSNVDFWTDFKHSLVRASMVNSVVFALSCGCSNGIEACLLHATNGSRQTLFLALQQDIALMTIRLILELYICIHNIYTHMCICVYVYIYRYMYINVYICIHIISMYIFIHKYIYIHKYVICISTYKYNTSYM